MAFPVMNAQVVSRLVGEGNLVNTVTHIVDGLTTGAHNLFSVPAVVDVSGMEFSLGVVSDNTDGSAGLAAEVGTSAFRPVMSDGGSGGVDTAVLFDSSTGGLSSSTVYTAYTPKDAAGTSTTDLDVDDWVNLRVTTNGATVAGAGNVNTQVAYVYGKPGAIN
jgi:hypothetical protein